MIVEGDGGCRIYIPDYRPAIDFRSVACVVAIFGYSMFVWAAFYG